MSQPFLRSISHVLRNFAYTFDDGLLFLPNGWLLVTGQKSYYGPQVLFEVLSLHFPGILTYMENKSFGIVMTSHKLSYICLIHIQVYEF